MRTVLMALALVAYGAHAAEDGPTPCDNVENDKQSLACSKFNRETAETEMKGALDDLEERTTNQYADHPNQLEELKAKINAAQALWSKLRDADCAIYTFNADKSSQSYQTTLNDCLAQKSDERSEYLQSVGME